MQGFLIYRLEGVDKGEEKPTDFIVVDDLPEILRVDTEGRPLGDVDKDTSGVGKLSMLQVCCAMIELAIFDAYWYGLSDFRD